VAREAGFPADVLDRLLDGRLDAVRGKRLVRLADALSTTLGYLVGLDPDDPVPEEWLAEDQGQLGLLAVDEEALLRAYRRLDVSSRAALLHVALRMSPEPEQLERKPRRL
ncbi:MAG: helix-turn-helix transcriptional regulator, partial [Caulobacteraceae bacterium]|nr:helix-turn-helix transcriptional regulator [Caulobacter sp.]